MGRPNGSGLRNPAPSHRPPEEEDSGALVPENLPEGTDAAWPPQIKTRGLKTFHLNMACSVKVQ